MFTYVDPEGRRAAERVSGGFLPGLEALLRESFGVDDINVL